jgi:UDP-N-acetylbacillosamine N-acetyltransferase
MSKPKLVIWGTGGHSLVVADIIRLAKEYEILGFLDDVYPERYNSVFCNAPILGGQEYLATLNDQGIHYLIFGFGNCGERLSLSEMIHSKGFSLATAIHPTAVIASDVIIGEGTVVAANAVVNSGSKIGQNVIINTCSSVDHECVIEDAVHISPGVHLAGRVFVGRASWIGIGATVVDGMRIGEHTLIGAGAVVVKDIPDHAVAHGIPAKVVRYRDK